LTFGDLRPTLPYYLALTKYGLLHLDATTFEFRPHLNAPPLAREMAKAVFTMGASSCIESCVMSRMLSEGPKVFAFDALTCEALENFDLSVSTADYLQPFPFYPDCSYSSDLRRLQSGPVQTRGPSRPPHHPFPTLLPPTNLPGGGESRVRHQQPERAGAEGVLRPLSRFGIVHGVLRLDLEFEVIDSDSTFQLRRRLGIDTNPWKAFPRIITSMDSLRMPDVLQQFLQASGAGPDAESNGGRTSPLRERSARFRTMPPCSDTSRASPLRSSS
jgi:hypothetical protein